MSGNNLLSLVSIMYITITYVITYIVHTQYITCIHCISTCTHSSLIITIRFPFPLPILLPLPCLSPCPPSPLAPLPSHINTPPPSNGVYMDIET